MSQKIAILRGINVGGKRKILMADLKAMFSGMGFTEVSTYIQSGNVFFTAQNDPDAQVLAKSIEEQISKSFGFDVPVIIRTPEEIENAINNNPFLQQGHEIEKLHLTFLNETPAQENLKLVSSFDSSPDQFKINDKDVFICCEGKYHQTKLSNNFFEKKLKVKATTRNWKTVIKLLDLSK